MEYLFLKRKKSTLRSERQKDLLFKAAERHWDEQFAGQGIVGRKVDCYISVSYTHLTLPTIA